MKPALPLSLCVIAVVLVGVPDARAQTKPRPQAGDSAVLEEVLVTARRREENIQEAPVAVTAISGDALRESGITNTRELSKSVPSLQINAGPDNMIFIRGIGQRAAGSFLQVDPAVSVYLDDMLLPRPDAQLLDTVDIKSVQVLRGPQGTLFGKNNTGGALVFALEKPHDSYEGYVEAGLGRFSRRRTRLGLNMPLSENLYTRFAVNVVKDDGYMEDLTQSNTSSDDRLSLLSQTRWETSDTLMLDVLAFYGRIRERLPVPHCEINNKNSLLNEGIGLLYSGDTNPANPRAFTENCEANSRRSLSDLTTHTGNFKANLDVETLLLGATLEWDIDAAHAIKLITSLRDETKGPKHQNNTDGGPAPYREGIQSDDSDRQSASLELQLNATALADRLAYTAGLFGMVEESTDEVLRITALNGIDSTALAALVGGEQPDPDDIPPGGTNPPLVGPLAGDPNTLEELELRNTTAAVFFQGSYSLTEQLELTAGLRYTLETRRAKLKRTPSDRQAVADRISADPRFGPADPFTGLHPYLLGTWADDPIGIANDLFPKNRFGVIDVPLNPAAASTEETDGTFRKATPMASLAYFLAEDKLDGLGIDSLMTYATWSNGFKSGFFEPRGVDGLQRVEPETLENREIGFKLDALSRSLRINMALYSMIFENMQLIQVSADSGANLAVIFANAGRSRVEGLELEANWMPLPRLLLNFSLSKNNYKFLEFEEFELLPLLLRGERNVIDRSDENFPVSPELSAALGIQYTWQTQAGAITPRLDISHKGEIYQGFDRGSWLINRQNKDLATSDAYTLLDARLSWRNTQETLTLTAYVKNLTDERYDLTGVSIGDLVGIYQQTTGEPRRYGVEARFTF